jgi:hypothetical protein
MTRSRENADGARLDAPLASPTFTGAVTNSSTTVATGLITANGGLETDTNSIIKDKGRFLQHSTHQSWVMGA